MIDFLKGRLLTDLSSPTRVDHARELTSWRGESQVVKIKLFKLKRIKLC